MHNLKVSSLIHVISRKLSSSFKSTMATPDLREGAKYWQYRYSKGYIDWQLKDVYPMLIRHYEKMNPNHKAAHVFYPMCGMSLDMNWMVDQGVSVVGVEVVRQALVQFVSNSNHNWVETAVPKLGTEAALFARQDNMLKLYCCDVQHFSSQIEGKFDAIYDRGSLQFVEPENLHSYVNIIKDLLNTGGRILLEVGEYDVKILNDEDFNPNMKVPPPYSMNTEDVKRLFEPDCQIEKLEVYTNDRFLGKKIDFHVHLITKK